MLSLFSLHRLHLPRDVAMSPLLVVLVGLLGFHPTQAYYIVDPPPGDPKEVPIGLTLGLCFGSVTLVMVLACCILKQRAGRRFERTIQKARKAVEQQEEKERSATEDPPLDVPTSGGYKATYRAVANFYHMTIRLDFTLVTTDNNTKSSSSSRPRAWEVSGSGQRNGIPFEISQGRAAPNGVMYWVERYRGTNKNGTVILNAGTFDFSKDTFRGRWETSQGDSTLYIEFELDEDATVVQDDVDVEENLSTAE
eukprot:scaffold1508_cov178-Amphora_coffeaeformis.AAC.26